MPALAAPASRERDIDRGYRLDSHYEAACRRVFLTGTQAIVRLLLEQRRRDCAQGLNTAGFVSGYRGSPLAGLDLSLWQAKEFLDKEQVRFQPAVNEDLAATAVLGSQQVESDSRRQVDGVFGLWYGKGPGVDRSGDALKHGNAFGSSPHGGVLVVAGDDHGCISSSMPHQSEQAFQAWSMPVLNPASVADYIPFGLFGYALSRFSGAWIGFKAISETVESGATVLVSEPPIYKLPQDFMMPDQGLHYRWPDLPSPKIEERLFKKLEAVQSFARANPIDQRVLGSRRCRFGIVTTGKAYLDLMAALEQLGVDRQIAEDLGLAVFKVGLSYPLARDGLLDFAQGLDEILVVEEKRSFVEAQLKDLLYNLPADQRPRLVGKRDTAGAPLLPEAGELSAAFLAGVLRRCLTASMPESAARLKTVDDPGVAQTGFEIQKRLPYFCAGCPHNTSTQIPEGSKAFGGIGCHFMASWMDRQTEGLIQMGGEGVNWVGRAPFVGDGHVFQNLGDGTYYHSGAVAIRQAIAAGINITYKILFNDAVAMTGGQPLDGKLTLPSIAAQVRAEGVERIAVVSDDPARSRSYGALPDRTTLHHRDELDQVQRELREVKGVSVLIYDQACAAEKRRKRKRGKLSDPPRRLVISEAVCEACGDCSRQSNCMAVVPKKTEFGVKRQIDQSACNKDFSCLKGFCPSFVTLEGALRRRSTAPGSNRRDFIAEAGRLPQPETELVKSEIRQILITGVGGTGVVTLGALVTMAAHLEGKGASVLDFMGFAQKGGAVLSHVKLAAQPEPNLPVRIDRECADTLIVCDLVVATSAEALTALAPKRGQVVGNLAETPTAEFTLRGVAELQADQRRRALRERAGNGNCEFFDAARLAKVLLGDGIYANTIVLGFAWQKGLVPVSLSAIDQAIELNAVAPDANRQAFAAGRLAAAVPDFIAQFSDGGGALTGDGNDLEQLLERRKAFLTDYQDAAYAARYTGFVEHVKRAETRVCGYPARLTMAVARSLFRLMAYKDEYEVARLLSDPRFLAGLKQEFEGNFRLVFNLAPPILNWRRDAQGRPLKRRFGAWLLPLLKVLAKSRGLRGTRFDPFGYSTERREERQLITDYCDLITGLLAQLTEKSLPSISEIAGLAEAIRGFGPVKAQSIAEYRRVLADRLEAFQKEYANREAA